MESTLEVHLAEPFTVPEQSCKDPKFDVRLNSSGILQLICKTSRREWHSVLENALAFMKIVKWVWLLLLLHQSQEISTSLGFYRVKHSAAVQEALSRAWDLYYYLNRKEIGRGKDNDFQNTLLQVCEWETHYSNLFSMTSSSTRSHQYKQMKLTSCHMELLPCVHYMWVCPCVHVKVRRHVPMYFHTNVF